MKSHDEDPVTRRTRPTLSRLRPRNSLWGFLFLVMVILLAGASHAFGAASAGYSEYYIPGDEEFMLDIFEECGSGGQGTTNHVTITVTAWSDNSTVYYDHWEDGYTFDPDDPDTADETYTLTNRGDSVTFESSNVPAVTRGTAEYYDGRDYVYVAGGLTTLCRASWTETEGPNQSLAWEVYPVRPQLTKYILPFGEDLDTGDGLDDFERVYALIQATEDNTVVTIDYDGDGTADPIDLDRDEDCSDSVTSVTLDKGEVFLLDNHSLCPNTQTVTTGTIILGTETLQVQYVIGDQDTNFEIRGLSAFPRGFWDKEYYAPADGGSGSYYTDIYLHNPWDSVLTINYQTSTGTGTFTVPANDTVSFAATEGFVPANTSVYLWADSEFWGVSTIDYEGQTYDWGYALVPAYLLDYEHFMGWAPSSYPVTAGYYANSGIYIASAMDNIRVFVDVDNDTAPDFTYDLGRLETQYIYDSVDGDLSDTNVWATGPYTMVYGEDLDGYTSNPALDVGYTTIPGVSFVELVLTVDKTVDPVMVATTSGEQSDFTLVVNSHEFEVNDINVVDFMPGGWKYVDDSTTITLVDKTTISGNSADPDFVSFRDDFDGSVYNNNSDNLPSGTTWDTDWNEEGEGDGASAGDIRIATDTGVTPNATALRFTDDDTAIARRADLSGYTEARLHFDYRRTLLEAATDELVCQVCADSVDGGNITCTSGWTDVVTIAGPTNDSEYQHYEVDLTRVLSGVNSADFAIRFTSMGGDMYPDYDYIYIDNVQVETPLIWDDTLLGDMDPNQEITITFTAETVHGFNLGDITRNVVEATGERTVGDPPVTQTFTASDFAFNGFGKFLIEKTTGGVDPLYPGDQYTYTVEVTNDESTDTLTGISIYDALPDGVSYVADSSEVTVPFSTVGDRFGTVAYTNNDGLVDWSAAWTEVGDDGSANSGRVLISGGELLLDDYPDSGGTPGLYRGADLSGATTASFTFDYRTTAGVDTSDAVQVHVQANGGGWNLLETITGIAGATSGSKNYDISAYISVNTEVRIRVSTYYGASDENFAVDDLFIEYDVEGTGSAGDPPNFVSTGDGYDLAPGETLTLTFDVTVDDPLAGGIEEIVNTAWATCAEIPLPISDDATNIVTNPTSGTADVGDRVWLDSDGDGVDDVGEPGLGNVEVTLKDEWGTPIATTTTDSTGRYLFTDVEPGDDYYVEVTGGLPAGLTQTAPSGHSDDRTEPFDLAAGDEYLDADLGYTPDSGTATFGDLVWSDADGDGVRDAGEPGLEGITVGLYLDDGDGVFDSGDTLVTSATTAAGGGYLITDITPSGSLDYFVYVDPSQAALSGYTCTTSDPFVNWNVSAGDVLINNDFGFQNTGGTAYSIEDRVWLDVDADEDDDVVAGDNGESGIAGVTVDLLDDSLNVIATTVTDSLGYFSFTGVPGGGADYTVRITDTDGILDDYYGTTAEAVAGEMAIDNLTGDLDYTTEPAEPNFGYNLSRTIGDLIWNDVDGDEVQDAGELGIGGVTVELYLDINGNGTLDAADPLQATQTTGAAGDYLFSGLGTGDYFVHVDNTQAMLSGYTLTTDDDQAASGHQRDASVSGNSSDLTADFGYRATSDPRAASGTVWDDDDEGGDIDVGESRFEDVTIELYLDDGDGVFEPGLGADDGLPVALTITDANGDYSFSGLVSNNYWVYVTDDYGILNGYETTYEKTEGTTSPFNDVELVDLTSSDQSDVDFGYYKPLATLVVLSSFRAYEDGGQTVVEWQTAAEVGTVGFYLKRLDEKAGRYTRVNRKLLPGLLHSLQGGTYRYVDTGAVPGETYTYKLIEVEASGKKRRYGPFTVTVGGQGLDLLEGELAAPDFELLISQYSRKAHKMSDAKKARIKAGKEARKKAKALRKKRQAKEKAKIAVREDGLYYVGASEIASVLGITSDKVENKIKKAKLHLSTQGKMVAYLTAADNSGIYFYGQGIESIYTEENMYWLKQGDGKKMRVLEGQGPEPASGDETFVDTVHVEEDLWALPAFFDDPEADYWLWDYIFSGYPGLDTKAFTVRADGASLSGTATLVATLQGGSDTGCGPREHHVVVSINGVQIGEAYWAGTTAHELMVEFDQSFLYDGENTVEVKGLRDTCAAYSIIYVDSFDVSYERLYRAVDNRLVVRGDGNPTVTIEGFTDDEIVVFDLTNARKPKLVNATTVDEAYDGYQVSFSPSTPDRPYLAMTMGASITVDSLTADIASTLKRKKNAVDYLVITPGDLKEGAQALADYRQGKGLKTMVVELQDIYDQFNHGIATPHAIKDFLSYAYQNWRRAPRYVVLAGEGTFDYKDIQGYGDNMIPPLMVSTPYGLFPSDNRFVDVEGEDSVPEMAIGRLPVVTAEELEGYIEKVFTYETSEGAWTKRILMVADDPDGGGNFPADSDDVAALLPVSYTAEKVYLPDHGMNTAHQLTLDGINNGALMMNYMGHGGLNCMAQQGSKGLLLTTDMPSLTNSDKLSVVAAFTCMVGQFSIPGYDALAEELVLKGGGGAVAVWAPTGLSENYWARMLDEEFFRAALEHGEKIVGASMLRAMEAYYSRGGPPSMLDVYTLLGDPALELR